MASTEELLVSVQDEQEKMIQTMTAMLRVRSMGPENGGQGEKDRVIFLENLLREMGFPQIDIVNAMDPRVQPGVRPSILAKIPGKSSRTVWIVAHTDTVSPGDEKAWSNPPFEPVIKDGKIYGRGAEDNGQAVIASIFAVKSILDLKQTPDLSIGLALVADEEVGSDFGIKYLISKGLFGKDDIFYVPDYGNEDGSVIEVAEKSIIWLQFVVKGKQVHASVPNKGINALLVGSEFLVFLSEHLYGKFSAKNSLFVPDYSTFEPTKRLANVENINTIPGEDIFFFDIRLLPEYDTKDCVDTARDLAKVFEERTGAKIDVYQERVDVAGRASSTKTDGARALSQAIRSVRGVEPSFTGIGGQTCANWFRRADMEAYVWQTVDEVAHQVNEYTWIKNLVTDAKVFAVLLAKLCYPSQFQLGGKINY